MLCQTVFILELHFAETQGFFRIGEIIFTISETLVDTLSVKEGGTVGEYGR